MSSAKNIRLALAFNGAAYCGWQIQPDRPSIQGTVCDAIRRVGGETVKLIGSGRTDAGTHARGLVANFRTLAKLPPAAWVPALNRLLPADIRVLSARKAPPSFHARLSAHSKVYLYQIYRGQVLPPHLAAEHCHYPYPVDFPLMRRAAEGFMGKHDFASFAARSGEKAHRRTGASSSDADAHAPDSTDAPGTPPGTIREIFRCKLQQRGRRLIFEVEGNGFLHHMVRNMVGTLLELGRGRISLEEFQGLFRARDRTQAGFTAPAHGLILLRVRY